MSALIVTSIDVSETLLRSPTDSQVFPPLLDLLNEYDVMGSPPESGASKDTFTLLMPRVPIVMFWGDNGAVAGMCEPVLNEKLLLPSALTDFIRKLYATP